MAYQDDWGQDPSVQKMRRIFGRVEKIQQELLEQLKISPFDMRLRRSREETLAMFERAWDRTTKRGAVAAEEEIASLYAHCLAKAIRLAGTEVPDELNPRDERIIRLPGKDLT